jgi:integrase
MLCRSPPEAITLLEALPRDGSPWIFIGAKAGCPLGHASLRELLKRIDPEITVHGFRSSFRDWAAEKTHYQNHVVEMALAHTISNKVEAAYRRGNLFEKRKQLMEAWAAFCCSAPSTGKVVPIRAA